MEAFHSKYLVSKALYEVCLPINGYFFSSTKLVRGKVQSYDRILPYFNHFFCFLMHEVLHILVINNKGDISLTFRGLYFWLNTNAILSKKRFLVFMSLPFIVLSVIPAITSFFVSDDIKSLILFISWINLIISSSDIVNSFLILIKPNKSVFCRTTE